MSKNKDIFFRGMVHLARQFTLDSLIQRSRQHLMVPVYHLVADTPPPHVKNLYKIKSTQQFKDELDCFLKYYRPIDLPDLIKGLSSGEPINENSFLLTFDDGLREFKDVIAAVLREKGVPAICFLNSDFIDNKGLFFRYKASLLIDHIKKEKLEKATIVQAWMRSNQFHENSGIENILLSIPYSKRELLDQLAATVRLSFDDYLEKEEPYLRSADIQALQKQGFHFGAHSCDHPPYKEISFAEQQQQTAKSLYEIKEQFDPEYNLFAFPFTDDGVSRKFFHWLHKREHRLTDLSFGTAGLKKEQYPRHIQRIPFELYDLSAEDVLKLEHLYYWVKGFLGRNRVRRF